MDKICTIFFTPFVPFIVLKTTVLNTRFQHKNRIEKQPSLSRDIEEKTILIRGLVWHAMLKHIFANISAQCGSFFKPIFALNHVFKTIVLSTIKGTNGVKKFIKIMSMNIKNHLKNPKLRENGT